MNIIKTLTLGFVICNQVFALSIFGDDDRKEWYEINDNKLKDISLSTAVRISKKQIGFFDGKYKDYYGLKRYFANTTYGKSNKMCSDEKFYNQIDIGSCSGFLINEDTLVTAGHCIQNTQDCNGSYWVFDYKMKSKDTDLRWGKRSNLFSCKRILKSKLSRKALGFGGTNNKVDYTIIKLDRSTKRPGLKLSNKRVHLGQDLTLIGYPSGLPLKISSNGKILRRKKKSFYASLDSFSGSSGSAVLDSNTLEVVGILIAGKEDFQQSHQKISMPGFSRPYLKKCNRLKKYDTNKKNSGEIVSNISNLFR